MVENMLRTAVFVSISFAFLGGHTLARSSVLSGAPSDEQSDTTLGQMGSPVLLSVF
jgi:hypothetical protein